MDKDQVIGSAKVVKGKVKVAIGKAIGDPKLQLQGEADKVVGKVQNTIGDIKDKK
ncbi:CsbD family protein [Maritalea sp.]|jgi:uncharacterized protein YjbJ (UPF0337 family)|uniref:CsbD family protein n=1 Tax=Maritalea sp. TaxID=2003361 RepID=UPI0039E69979